MKSEKRRNWIGTVIAGALLLAAVLAYVLFGGQPYTVTTFSMGSYVQQTVYGHGAEAAAGKASQAVTEIDNKFSWRIPGSDIDRLNRSEGKWIDLDPDTWKLLSLCQDVAEAGAGGLDVTIAPVSRLWDFDGDPHVPGPEELAAALRWVDYCALSLSPPDGSPAAMLEQGYSLDLGAVGKGSGCDAALRSYRESGVNRAVVAVGGSIGLYGEKPFGKPWIVAVRDPSGSGSLGELALPGGCVSTSGSYEKTFTENGEIYHHIIDPRTGMPAAGDLVSVTVWRNENDGLDGAVTDALSTACFVRGRQNSRDMLHDFCAEAVFVTKDGKVYATPGLKDRFVLTAEGYTLEDLP